MFLKIDLQFNLIIFCKTPKKYIMDYYCIQFDHIFDYMVLLILNILNINKCQKSINNYQLLNNHFYSTQEFCNHQQMMNLYIRIKSHCICNLNQKYLNIPYNLQRKHLCILLSIKQNNECILHSWINNYLFRYRHIYLYL